MSDEAKRYNGWTNYETWCVHLWLTNEEGSYRYWRDEASRHRKESGEDASGTLAEQLKEQGHRAGLKTGRAEGFAQGHGEMLLKLLRTRFGKVSPRVVAKVRAADEAKLDQWASRIFTAQQIDDVITD